MNTGRALLGVALVALGALLLLDQGGVLDAGAVIADWWPTILLVGAGLDLLSRPPRWTSAMVLGVLGFVLLANTTGVVDTSVWAVVWPLLVIGLGLRLLLGHGRPAMFGGSADLAEDEQVHVTALFSGRRVAATGPVFRGGSATAVFGGVEVDLSGAHLADEVVLDVVALFGGVDVEVPPGVRVVLDGPAIFGGNDNHVPPVDDPAAPVLRVRATAIFGGVDVKPAAVVTIPPAVASV